MMAEVVLSSAVRVLVQNLASVRGLGILVIEGKLEKLNRSLENVRTVLQESERKLGVGLPSWLRELEIALGTAEDVVDEVEYEFLRRKVADVKDQSKVRLLIAQLPKYNRLAERIEKIQGKLDEIGLEQIHETGQPVSGRRETTSLLSEPFTVGREEEKLMILEWLLTTDDVGSFSSSSRARNNDHPSVLSVLGLGGLGKTHLVQRVYNDECVAHHFNLRLWVHVSEDFDVKSLTQSILQNVLDERDQREYLSYCALDTLSSKLAGKLSGKRFLLVLDDIWEFDIGNFDRLFAPLRCGREGSKVIVTTRLQKVADTVSKPADQFHLKGLQFDECWYLLEQYTSSILEEREDLKKIAKEIVKKLSGVPLAIKTVAGLLCSNVSLKNWVRIKENELWELEQDENGIVPALRLSYDNLPLHLRRCLACCSLFPKGHIFQRSKLVKLWMAQGFIPGVGEREPEDIGNNYFIELRDRSFFQYYTIAEDAVSEDLSDNYYIMPDLLHDLARFISKGRCFVIKSDNQHKVPSLDPSLLHHLSLFTTEPLDFQSLWRFKSTRTLLCLTMYSHTRLPANLFLNLICLRLLDLSHSNIEELPNSIGKLIHLRYLDLSHTPIRTLPRPLFRLYNLVVLQLEGCGKLERIPNAVNRLLRLRHLNADAVLVSKISAVGSLVVLQELKLFRVFKKDGFKIRELKNMNQLRGEIHIEKLENVYDAEEAQEAALNNKEHLTKLALTWTENWNQDTKRRDGEVLDALQPHRSLQDLSISGNGGSKFPKWIDGKVIPLNLRIISLSSCVNWRCLPPLGRLPFLKSLDIKSMHGVEKVVGEFFGGSAPCFPSLVYLRFFDMPVWREWLTDGKLQAFPCLKQLFIEKCPVLHSILVPPSLEYLGILDCPNLPSDLLVYHRLPKTSMLNSFTSLTSWADGVLLRLLPSKIWKINFTSYGRPVFRSEFEYSKLQEHHCAEGMHITTDYLYSNYSNFHDLCNLLSANLQGHSIPLQQLNVSGCLKTADFLESVLPFMAGLEKFAIIRSQGLGWLDWLVPQHQDTLLSIKSLSILYCDVEAIRGHFLQRLKSLEELEIGDCDKLESIEVEALFFLKSLVLTNIGVKTLSLHSLTALTVLKVQNCNQLESMNLEDLVSLQNIEIKGCLCLNSLNVNEKEEDMGYLSSLKSMVVWFCPELAALPLQCLTALEELELLNCDSLASIGIEGLVSLKRMVILNCSSLTSFSAMKGLTSLYPLEKLHIINSTGISSLPEDFLTPSLAELCIRGCPLVKEKCQDGGTYWSKIAHIPCRDIS